MIAKLVSRCAILVIVAGCALPKLGVEEDEAPDAPQGGVPGVEARGGSPAGGGGAAGLGAGAGQGGEPAEPVQGVAVDGTIVRIGEDGEDQWIELAPPNGDAVLVAPLPAATQLVEVAFSPDGSKAGLWLRYRAPEVAERPVTDDQWVVSVDERSLLRKARKLDSVLTLRQQHMTDFYAELQHTPVDSRQQLIASIAGQQYPLRWYMFNEALSEADVLAIDSSWATWAFTLDVPTENGGAELLVVRDVVAATALEQRTVQLNGSLTASLAAPAGVATFDLPEQAAPGAQSFLVLDADGNLLLDGLPPGSYGRELVVRHAPGSTDLTLKEWTGSAWSEEETTLRYFAGPALWRRLHGSFDAPDWAVTEQIQPEGARTIELRDTTGALQRARSLGENVRHVETSMVGDYNVVTITKNAASIGDHHDVWIVDSTGEPVVEGVDPSVTLRIDQVTTPLNIALTLWQAGQGFPAANERTWTLPFGEVSSNTWGVRQNSKSLGVPRLVEVTNGNGSAIAGLATWQAPPFSSVAPPLFSPNGDHAMLLLQTPLSTGTAGLGADFYHASATQGVRKLFSGGQAYQFEPSESVLANDRLIVMPVAVIPVQQQAPFLRRLPMTSIYFDGSARTEDTTSNLRAGNSGSSSIEDGIIYTTDGGTTTGFSSTVAGGSLADLNWTPILRITYRSAISASMELGYLDVYGQNLLSTTWLNVALPNSAGQSAEVTVDVSTQLSSPSRSVLNQLLISNTVGAAQITALVFEGKAQ